MITWPDSSWKSIQDTRLLQVGSSFQWNTRDFLCDLSTPLPLLPRCLWKCLGTACQEAITGKIILLSYLFVQQASSRVWGFFLKRWGYQDSAKQKKLGWLDGFLSFSTPKAKIHSSMSDGQPTLLGQLPTERRSRWGLWTSLRTSKMSDDLSTRERGEVCSGICEVGSCQVSC